MPKASVERGARVGHPGWLSRFSGGSDAGVSLFWSVAFSIFENTLFFDKDCVTGMSARMSQAR